MPDFEKFKREIKGRHWSRDMQDSDYKHARWLIDYNRRAGFFWGVVVGSIVTAAGLLYRFHNL